MNDVKEAFGKRKNVTLFLFTLFLFVEANDTLGIVFNPRFHLLAPDIIYVMRTFMKFSDAAGLFPEDFGPYCGCPSPASKRVPKGKELHLVDFARKSQARAFAGKVH